MKILSAAGKRTPAFLRFSTVAGSRGAPDTARDPRGFALKFYTRGRQLRPGRQQHARLLHQGRDQVPRLHPLAEVRPVHRPPGGRQRLGLLPHSPEATHQFTWLFGDRGIPASYRHMNGYGSHTFQWDNEAGEVFWVKYHFKTDQGIRTSPRARPQARR